MVIVAGYDLRDKRKGLERARPHDELEIEARIETRVYNNYTFYRSHLPDGMGSFTQFMEGWNFPHTW